jgi:hypothetical protein
MGYLYLIFQILKNLAKVPIIIELIIEEKQLTSVCTTWLFSMNLAYDTTEITVYFSLIHIKTINMYEVIMRKFRASMEPFWDLKIIGKYVEYLTHVSSEYVIFITHLPGIKWFNVCTRIRLVHYTTSSVIASSECTILNHAVPGKCVLKIYFWSKWLSIKLMRWNLHDWWFTRFYL